MELNDMPLAEAIAKVGQLYGVDILYADELLRAKTVNARIENAAIEDALTVLLQNSDVAFARENESQIILYKKRQQALDIYGWVLDAETGETLPYAHITIPGTGLGTTSNSDGRFRLASVPSGTQQLSAAYMGYSTRSIALESSNLSPQLFIRLNPDILQTESVTVLEQQTGLMQYESYGDGFAVSNTFFRQLPLFHGSDALSSLQFVPGVQGSAGAGTALSIRAGRPSENLVALDGIPLYHTDHAFGVLSTIPTSVVKDMRVYKNAFPARFGGRTSSVVELTGKTGSFKNAAVDIETNLSAMQAIIQLPLSPKSTFIISGRHSLDNSIPDARYKKISETPPFMDDFVQTVSETVSSGQPQPRIRYYDLYSKWSFVPTKNDLLNVTFIKTEDRIEDNRNTISGLGSPNWSWSTEGLSAGWLRLWDRSWQSKLLLSRSRYAVSQNTNANDAFVSSLPQGVRVNNDLQEKRMLLNTEYSGFDGHLISGGFEYSEITTDFVEWHPQYRDILEHGIRGITNAIFLEDRWNVSERLKVSTGFRASHFDLTKKWYYSPRVSLAYALFDNVTLKSAYGRYYQFINSFGHEFPNYVGQQSWLVSDGGLLKPAASENIMAGFTWNNTIADVDLEVFQKDASGVIRQQNSIDTTQVTPLVSTLLQNKSRIYGLDLMLRRQMDRVHTWLSYSYNNTSIESRTTGDYPLPGLSPHMLKLASSVVLDKWTFAAVWHWQSGRYYTVPVVNTINEQAVLSAPQKRSNKQLPATQRLDFSVDYTFQAGFYSITLGSNIFNVLDSQNAWYKSFDVQKNTLQSLDVFQDGFSANFFLRLSF